jgi:hypothetical protein
MYVLATIKISYGMHDPSELTVNEMRIVPTWGDPLRAQYVTKDCVVISDFNGCYIQNLNTGVMQSIQDSRAYFRTNIMSLQSINKKIFLSNPKGIMIYDTETNKKEWATQTQIEEEPIMSLAVHEAGNTLFVGYGEQYKNIRKYNYRTNEHQDIPIHGIACEIMTINNKKDILAISDFKGNISLYSLDNLIKLKNISLSQAKSYFCKYSIDGSCMVSGNDKKLYIIDLDDDNVVTYPSIDCAEKEVFCEIAFHPHEYVLATLTNQYEPSPFHGGRQQVIQYWDLKTQKLIYTTSDLLSMACHDISFSQDGLEVLATLEHKCVRMLVPFLITNKFLYLLFVFKRLKKQLGLPQDILNYCKNILSKT